MQIQYCIGSRGVSGGLHGMGRNLSVSHCKTMLAWQTESIGGSSSAHERQKPRPLIRTPRRFDARPPCPSYPSPILYFFLDTSPFQEGVMSGILKDQPHRAIAKSHCRTVHVLFEQAGLPRDDRQTPCTGRCYAITFRKEAKARAAIACAVRPAVAAPMTSTPTGAMQSAPRNWRNRPAGLSAPSPGQSRLAASV